MRLYRFRCRRIHLCIKKIWRKGYSGMKKLSIPFCALQKEVGRKEEMGYNNNIFNRRFSEKRRELYGNTGDA